MALNDSERRIHESLPGGLLTNTEISTWGALRKVLGNWLEARRDELEMLYMEQDIDTSDPYLFMWEQQQGLSQNPSGRTLAQRRAYVKTRLEKGPFTRTRRRKIVESFITATFGPPAAFTPAGIPITAGGIPLYNPASSLAGLYAIVENVTNFSYEVRVKDTLAIDIAGLQRELDWVTPGGLSFTITQTPTP